MKRHGPCSQLAKQATDRGRFYASSKSADQLSLGEMATHNCQKRTNPHQKSRENARFEGLEGGIVPVFWVSGVFCVVWQWADIYSDGINLIP